MVAKNTYATLQEYKEYAYIEEPDADDDLIIDRMLEQASRTIEGECGRVPYPQIKTLYFDLPKTRDLNFYNHDLLEVLSLKNGNGDEIASTEYSLLPYNLYPKFGLQLTDVTTVQWYTSSEGSSNKVVTLQGIFGYHLDYYNALLPAGTLASAMSDTTTTTITASSGHAVRTGNIIRVGNELMVVESVDNVTLTVKARGDNGSTAATHDVSSVIYVWSFQEEFALACKVLVNSLYKLRTGASEQGEVRVLPSGTVKVSGGIPKYTRELIERVRRKL